MTRTQLNAFRKMMLLLLKAENGISRESYEAVTDFRYCAGIVLDTLDIAEAVDITEERAYIPAKSA